MTLKEIKNFLLGFRLLTEYHSFLFEDMQELNTIEKALKGFRLLTEYHSFLFHINPLSILT